MLQKYFFITSDIAEYKVFDMSFYCKNPSMYAKKRRFKKNGNSCGVLRRKFKFFYHIFLFSPLIDSAIKKFIHSRAFSSY